MFSLASCHGAAIDNQKRHYISMQLFLTNNKHIIVLSMITKVDYFYLVRSIAIYILKYVKASDPYCVIARTAYRANFVLA